MDSISAPLTPAGSTLAPGEVGPISALGGQGHGPRAAIGDRQHIVQFYEADSYLASAVADYVAEGLLGGDAAIVVATAPHRLDVERLITARGADLAAAHASGRYLSLDAAETLLRISVDGYPDLDRFADVVGGAIARAAADGRRVRVFGEMVALQAIEGAHDGAIRLEKLWNALQRSLDFTLYCAYPMRRLGGSRFAEFLADVCSEHTSVIPAESYTALPTDEDRLRAVVALQQKAQSLEAALAAERSARLAAEEAVRAREEFLSVAAHELKTPLTSLWSSAQLLLRRLTRERNLGTEQIERAVETVSGQADKLTHLVNQLFDVARLDSGKLALEIQAADLTQVVRRVVAQAQARDGDRRIDVVAPSALQVWCDPLRLEQVVTNLVDNAAKYSPSDEPIEVELSCPSGGIAQLTVRDRGIGIPPEKRDRLFERFYQAHLEARRSGIGLGLYVSRQIVELHGGEIRAEFPSDGGTRMVVRLPIRRQS